jgi:hypothetical protein
MTTHEHASEVDTRIAATAPLERFRVIGILEKVTQAGKGAPRQPGSSCWHCGTGIMICVVSKNLDTGEIVDIGTTCAERIGLDPEGLARYMRERREELRAARWAADAERRDAERAYRDEEILRLHGDHGTDSRYAFGCSCPACREAAPHGTGDHFWNHACSCAPCVEGVLRDHRDFRVRDLPVLVDLSTGQVADARLIDGKYGMSWLVGDEFVPHGRKRRETVAKRGYTYARASFVMRPADDQHPMPWRIRRLSSPTVDDFGVEVPCAGSVTGVTS